MDKSNGYIIRSENGRWATLVQILAIDPTDPHAEFAATESRTEYTEYCGLLCRHWNNGDGQGSKFSEACNGLRSIGGTIPVRDGADIAFIVQTEYRHRTRIQLPIIDAA